MNEIGEYYNSKTQKIIEEFGPGPIIHYHTGIKIDNIDSIEDRFILRKVMHLSQNKTIELIKCNIKRNLNELVMLDIGCGLGGTALFFAKHNPLEIIGISVASEHIELANKYSKEIGLQDTAIFIESDATVYRSHQKIDICIAIESMCYMNRKKVICNIAKQMNEGAELHIIDWALGKESLNSRIVDIHWKTELGYPNEYIKSAKENDLELIEEKILNEDATKFYQATKKWNICYMKERDQKENSDIIKAQDALINGFSNGDIVSMYQIYRKKY